MRRTAADAVLVDRCFERIDDSRVIRQPQIIITAKIDDLVAVELQLDALRRVDYAPGAV
jgi:hypothetical protein